MFWIALFFFLSGLCSIVYELVWLRLAMAKFGVNTPLVSIVLSVFMAGLGAGSWIAGWATRRYGDRIRFSPLRLYGFIELLIGISALVVPLELALGSRLLESIASQVSMSSGTFYLLSGPWLALTLIPWCTCMGATIPVAMVSIRRSFGNQTPRSFSFLYLSNVIGAVAGACLAPALIELYGFHGTLRSGAMLNALIFILALGVSFALQRSAPSPGAAVPESPSSPAILGSPDRSALLLLFTTGLTTMGAEVVWIRLYTYFIGPVVYSFALILAAYLAATFLGSMAYRVWSRRQRGHENPLLWISLAFFGLLPLLTADTRLLINNDLRVILGVAPFAGIIGFLTPMLVDRWSGGDPDRAGRAYAVNIVGCILGPLLAGFILLPLFGERTSMLLLALPWFGVALFGGKRKEAAEAQRTAGWQTIAAAVLLIGSLTIFAYSKDYEALFPKRIVLRDSTATVIAAGEGMDKRLLVNGFGMTVLTPVTKMMAHFTLASLTTPPRNVLIVCFGMGTTFRSAMSWGVPVTAVELVPSVPKLFTYYHPDGAAIMASPRAHVVIDDGRRFLDRTAEKFDAIIIDPPPPTEAAGSSLLYSRDFYVLAKQHLAPGGILQQWFFFGDNADRAAVTRALTDVFPCVRVFQSMWGDPSFHFLASDSPILNRTATDLVMRTPPDAIKDMMEWGPAKTPQEQYELLLSRELSPQRLTARSPGTPSLDDDHPINEYFRIRQSFP
jgi:predicted membrane-bound spermidine synthase